MASLNKNGRVFFGVSEGKVEELKLDDPKNTWSKPFANQAKKVKQIISKTSTYIFSSLLKEPTMAVT